MFKLTSKIPNSLTILIGNIESDYLKELEYELKQETLNNVILLGQISTIELYSVLQFCDYGIISYANIDLNNTYCAPNKLYEYAALRLPMLTTNQDLFIETFNNYKIGVAINTNSYKLKEVTKELKKITIDKKKLNLEFDHFNETFSFNNEQLKLCSAVKEFVSPSI